MATPLWFTGLSAPQQRAVLAAQASSELLTYLKGQGISLPKSLNAELAAGVNVGRSFGVWLKRKLELEFAEDDNPTRADERR